MRKTAVLAGTGFEGRDEIIRAHCRDGMPIILERQPDNPHDPNAVAVFIDVSRLGGLLGTSRKQIGFIKANTAKSLAKAIDSGKAVTGYVKSFWAPDGRDYPRVTVEITDEI
jgi:hypothetical protein